MHKVTYLIYMSSNNKDGSFWSLYRYRAQPKVQSCMFMSKPYIPQQKIYSPVCRQEKLKISHKSIYLGIKIENNQQKNSFTGK